METITKYKAFDGREFMDADECAKYEVISERIVNIVAQLGEQPDLSGCGFANGDGYLQHEKDTFMKVRNSLCEVAYEITPHHWFKETIEKGLEAHESYAGRIISEMGNRSLDKAWQRIACTDSQFREWGQPYYANHPEEAKQVQLN